MNPETVTVLSVETEDDYGQKTRAVDHTELGWIFGGASSSEDNDKRNTVVTDINAYNMIGSTLKPSDVIERPDGSRWEVIGEITDWAHFNGWHAGVEATFRKVAG